MGTFIAIVVAFALGIVFGGYIGWKKGMDGKDWLWWKAFTGKR